MYNVKLYNKISKVGLDDLDPAKYAYSEEMNDYDAVLVRSAKLHDVEFPKNLKCIARAGAGVNITPVAFLVVRGESVRMLPVAEPASTSMDRLIEQLPDLLDKAEHLLKQKRLAKEEGIE